MADKLIKDGLVIKMMSKQRKVKHPMHMEMMSKLNGWNHDKKIQYPSFETQATLVIKMIKAANAR